MRPVTKKVVKVPVLIVCIVGVCALMFYWLLSSAPLASWESLNALSIGMTEDEVIRAVGKPGSARLSDLRMVREVRGGAFCREWKTEEGAAFVLVFDHSGKVARMLCWQPATWLERLHASFGFWELF